MSRFEEYYNAYWNRRLDRIEDKLPPIRQSIPKILVKYSQYGACLNLVPEKSKLLDIGCGEGNITELYRIYKGCEIHGLELSEVAIKMAEKRGLKVTKWDLNEYPYPYKDSVFEVITIIDVLEHVINPVNLLCEANRMLKSGGRIIVLVPNFARLANRVRMLFMGDPKDILHWGGYGDGMEHFHWFTQPKLKEFMKHAGFQRLKFYPIGLPFDFIYGLIRKYNWARLLIAIGDVVPSFR